MIKKTVLVLVLVLTLTPPESMENHQSLLTPPDLMENPTLTPPESTEAKEGNYQVFYILVS